MNIIGLGQAGCQVAKNFEKYKQYDVFCVDTEDKGYERFLAVEKQISHEYYEKNYKKLDLPANNGPTTFILNGTGDISGCCLRLLEQLNDGPITIIYIKSDEAQLTGPALLKDRATFNILQQYARSAVFEMMYIIANKNIEEVIENLSLKNYWRDVNDIISSTYHMINVFENTEPLLSSSPLKAPPVRIGTMGVINYKTNKEKLFYNLKHTRFKKYFYGLNSDSDANDKDTLYEIRKFVEASSDEKIDSGFVIYSTEYEHNYVYSIHCASFIQEQNIV